MVFKKFPRCSGIHYKAREDEDDELEYPVFHGSIPSQEDTNRSSPAPEEVILATTGAARHCRPWEGTIVRSSDTMP